MIGGILDEKQGLAKSQPSIEVDHSLSFPLTMLIDESL